MVDVELGAARFEQFQRADDNAQAENVTFVNNPALQETNAGEREVPATTTGTAHEAKTPRGPSETFCFIFWGVFSCGLFLFTVLFLAWCGAFAGVG